MLMVMPVGLYGHHGNYTSVPLSLNANMRHADWKLSLKQSYEILELRVGENLSDMKFYIFEVNASEWRPMFINQHDLKCWIWTVMGEKP